MKNVILLIALTLPSVIWAQMSSTNYQSKDNGSYTSGAYQNTPNYQNFILGTWFSNHNAVSASYKTSNTMPSGFSFILCGDIQISSSGATVFCPGDSVTLSTTDLFENYQWSNGSNDEEITVSTTSEYHLVVTDSAGCVSSSDTIFVQVFAPLIPSIVQNGDSLTTETAQSYQWFFDGVSISGATSNILIPTEFGEYEVMVIDSNSCSGMSQIFNYEATGVNLNEFTNLDFYPNPVSDILTIQGSLTKKETFSIELNSSIGQSILQKEINPQATDFSFSLDLSAIADGYYFLIIRNDNRVLNMSKLIKINSN